MALTRFERFLASMLRGAVGMLFAVFQLLAPRRGADRSVRRLPPITNPLLRVPAMQLARMIRRREVTSVEVVQTYIDRIQEINPLINAMVKDRFSLALQEAAQVDKLIEEETGGEDVLEDRLPLLGVPFTVKEAFSLQGMPNSTGLVSRRGVISATDAPPVALLKRAGAIPLGVTNCSELCMWLESHNRLYGITNNPYDLERIPGGSSGGEGSILGGGGSVIGVGSDVGGSIRIPAFFNGIFGHKPTSGVVSNVGQFSSLYSVGVVSNVGQFSSLYSVGVVSNVGQFSSLYSVGVVSNVGQFSYLYSVGVVSNVGQFSSLYSVGVVSNVGQFSSHYSVGVVSNVGQFSSHYSVGVVSNVGQFSSHYSVGVVSNVGQFSSHYSVGVVSNVGQFSSHYSVGVVSNVGQFSSLYSVGVVSNVGQFSSLYSVGVVSNVGQFSLSLQYRWSI
ncbi:fatty-acid amide hydrolase 2-A isoform X2 [Salmo salar]|uniref:Fatty-acid amide hydrolase 2-A isoform X2 n=1 Tax=Salmo salar TaxID=8030 RepID=A0A1S3RCY4_SALSA|nr:fatty-acid amide hydrolase 2-A-like isoform X2 [Salmo salar]